MEDLRLSWLNIFDKREEGKLFYNLLSKKFDKKYYLFCYYGHPTYDKYYDGDKFKHVVFYLKKKISKKEYVEIHTELFTVPLNTYLPLHLERTYGKLILAKVIAEERKEKISKILK